MNRGVPPTEWKARTGELTPPGMTRSALSKSWAERDACTSGSPEETVTASSVPVLSNLPTTGCSGWPGSLCPIRRAGWFRDERGEHRPHLLGQFQQFHVSAERAALEVRELHPD